MQIYLNILALSLGASVSIGILSILRRATRKRYSTRWICIAWLVLCVRMLVPIQLFPTQLWMNGFEALKSNPIRTDSEKIVSDIDTREEYGANGEYVANEENGANVEYVANEEYRANSVQGSRTSEEIGDEEIADVLNIEGEKVTSQRKDSGNNQLESYNSESSSKQRNNLLPRLERIKDKIQLEVLRKIVQLTYFIWLGGVILLWLSQMFSYQVVRRRIEKIIRGTNSIKYQAVIKEISVDYHIKREISCYCCKEVKTPMLIGLFHPKIILPQIDYEPQEMDTILRHELTHYKHHDTWKKLLLQSVKILYWFCPTISRMSTYAKEDIELFCDETVIRNQALTYRKSYSMAILRTIAEDQNYNCEAFTACLSNGNKEIKQRILCILGEEKTKKGSSSLIVAFFAIFLLCNLCLVPMNRVMSKVISNANENDITPNDLVTEDVTTSGNRTNQNYETDKAEDTRNTLAAQNQMKHIVLLGLTNEGEGAYNYDYTDSIILVSFHWKDQQLILTSISRNLHVFDENGKSIKLMQLFKENESEFYHQLQNVLGIELDGAISIGMEEFEAVIDALGGVEINLTEEEKDYLNRTNFISQQENRCVTEGIQTLNGNQALGYARVRMVPAINGASGEWGRDVRHEQLLLSLYENMKGQLGTQQTKLFLELINHVKTTIELSQMEDLIQEFMEVEWTIQSESYPAEGDWRQLEDSKQMMLEAIRSYPYLYQNIG